MQHLSWLHKVRVMFETATGHTQSHPHPVLARHRLLLRIHPYCCPAAGLRSFAKAQMAGASPSTSLRTKGWSVGMYSCISSYLTSTHDDFSGCVT